MNILQLIPELSVGGTERGTVELARGLVARGHKSFVISGGGELVKLLDEYGSRHDTLPVGAKNPWTVFRMVKHVSRVIREENIDIVHARSRVPGLIAFLACRRTGRPFVTTCHGYYRKNLFGYLMGWGKKVIVSSHAIGKHMTEDFEVSPERIRLIPRGVDLTRFSYHPPRRNQEGEFTVGIIGRITPLKGHIDFIRAISRLVRTFPKIRAVIVGEAPPEKARYKQELELLVKRLGLHQTIQWIGTSYDIPKVLSGMDLLVLASRTPEAFGRVIIEAGASGVPVVATRVGGVIDILSDGKEGLLVPPEDPLALSDAMVKILKHPDLALQFSKQLREKVEKEFSLEGMIEKTILVYEEALKEDRILVVKLSAIGDVVLTTPSLRAIRKKFPDSHITCLVGRDSFELIQHSPYLNDLLVYDPRRKDRKHLRFLRLGSELRRRGFDRVVDLQNNKTSQLLSFLSLAPKRYGFDRGLFRFLVNIKIKDPGAMPPVEHQGKLLSLLGVDVVDPELELWPQPKDKAFVEQFLKGEWLAGNEPLVGVNLGGSPRWETKRWPVSHIAQLCDRLAQDKIRVVITGTEKEKSLARELFSEVKAKPISAVGKTNLPQLMSLIQRCRVFVTVDSAPLHLAAGVGTPVIALFGPTDPKRHFPQTKKGVVLNKKVKCHPCYKRRCPIGLICMTRITPQEVYQEVKRFLGKDA